MEQTVMKETATLPMLALRGMVVFPNTLIHFDVVREKSLLALENAMVNKQLIFVSMQTDPTIENPKPADIENVGTICKISQVVKMPNNTVRVLVEGLKRAKIYDVARVKPYFVAVVDEVEKDDYDDTTIESEALRRKLVDEFMNYCDYNNRVNSDFVVSLENVEDTARLADSIASNMPLKLLDKQKILNIESTKERAETLLELLIREIQIAEVDTNIDRKVKKNIDKNQREYFLREQLKVIHEELGDDSEFEVEEYKSKLKKLDLPQNVVEKCEKELARLSKMSVNNPDANVIRTYLEWICDLPWNNFTKDTLEISNAKEVLDRDHYGLKEVKERIMEYLAVKKITSSMAGPILCLVGPPGVGKTSIAKSIAESMGRSYARISLGGIRDEADIRGHRRTYIGSMPGRIITALKQAGTNNPLMLFDEIDKMASDYRGDPAAALLEVLDSEQNTKFRDHFMEVDFDLSNVLFIATANTLDTIPRPLLDRMEIIEIPGYTSEEKFQIAKNHLLSKQLKNHGLTKKQVSVSDTAIKGIIAHYTKEAGVRALERKIANVLRKSALKIVDAPETQVKITGKNLEEFLGKEIFSDEFASKKDEVGVVCGLAWTQVGGDTLSIEVNVMDGTGNLELTGQLGDVMKESAKAAVSYVRSESDKLGIDSEFYKKYDIHIHVPEGATPKDGPSAGITIATALVSALSQRAVNHKVAMTGEITIRGRVLPIGGLREKTLAAYQAGIKTVVIPFENKKDIDELENVVKENIDIIPARNMNDVLKVALV
ncbi:MAG: endopeptidase La [Clostridia bacterium]|nr:endopeptidase La [Clostridia bacterium]